MKEQVTERCIFCGADIFYTEDDSAIKCTSCGKTIILMQFQSEQIRIRKALRDKEQVQKDLEAAKMEKEAAQNRLNQAVSSLLEIRGSQESEKEQIDRIFETLQADRKTQEALLALTLNLRKGQEEDSDVLQTLLMTVMDGRDSIDQKLEIVQEIVQKILGSQGDIAATVHMQAEIVRLLENQQTDQDKLINSFYHWSQAIRKEDLERLQNLKTSILELLEGEQELDRKIDDLEQSVGETNRIVRSFQNQWEQSRMEELFSLYRQAENYQHDREFEKAGEYYRNVVIKGGADAEVYWRLILCHYCVEYQKDEYGNLIPIILNPDLTNPSEMSIRTELENKVEDQYRDYYRNELGKIDQILDKYRQIRHQLKYDVFISVKQNQGGHYTEDSDVATDLYDYLTDKGLRVFNSRRTVIPAGQEFEPYIISALISSKVLIVVGTCAENMNAQWVRNEWSRFQWMQRYEQRHHGKTDRVMFCYLAGGMKPEHIPRALNPNMQAVIDGVKAHHVLDQSLAFLLPKQNNPSSDPTWSAQTEYSFQTALTQMRVWLYNNKYEQVLEKYDELTEKGLFLDSALIHLCALCAEKQVHSTDLLAASYQINLDEEPKFQLALNLNQSDEDHTLLIRLQTKNKGVRELHAMTVQENDEVLPEQPIRQKQEKAEQERKRLEEEQRKQEEERKRHEQLAYEEKRRKEEAERQKRQWLARELQLEREKKLEEYLQQALPTVHSSARVGMAIPENLRKQAVKMAEVSLADDEKVIGLICLKGLFEGNAVVLLTKRKIYINMKEKIYPTVVAEYEKIASTKAVPLNTNPKKKNFVITFKNGSSLITANPSAAMKDVINFSALSIMLNEIVDTIFCNKE